MQGITVALADPLPVVRLGLHRLFEGTPEIRVAGEASGGKEALALAERLSPSVLLLELDLPDLAGTEVIRKLKASTPRTSCLPFCLSDDTQLVVAALRSGARGYLLKEDPPERIVNAVRQVASGGERCFSPRIARAIADLSLGGDSVPRLENGSLSHREQRLFRLIARGLDNAEIAARLGLSEQTVRNYCSRLYARLGVRTRAEAVVRGREWFFERRLGPVRR